MTAWQLLVTNWELHPSVVIGCVLLLGIYYCAAGFKLNGKAINFTLGVLIIFIALCSPIDELSDDYLFSVHMLQHMLLYLTAPALMIAGLTEPMVQSWLGFPLIARIERILGFPPLALIIAVVTFWAWHFPSLYNATLQNEVIHIFEHITFMIAGAILWWPVFKPIREHRLAPVAAIVYISIAASLDGLLGIIFTIADTPFYASYANPAGEPEAVAMIRKQWGLTQLYDQKLGGSIMWGFGSVIFLWAMMEVMIGWFREGEEESLSQWGSERDVASGSRG